MERSTTASERTFDGLLKKLLERIPAGVLPANDVRLQALAIALWTEKKNEERAQQKLPLWGYEEAARIWSESVVDSPASHYAQRVGEDERATPLTREALEKLYDGVFAMKKESTA